jgi:sterol 3beta-glucosyltransferase
VRLALATVGTIGDVAPFVILGRALQARGHDVTTVTWPIHRSAFADAGLRVATAGPHADGDRIRATAVQAASKGPLEQVAILREFHLVDGADHLRRLRDLLAGHDLVVVHGIHSLAHAAVLDVGARWASAAFDPVLLPTRSAAPPGMPNVGPLNALAWSLLNRALGRVGRPLDAVLTEAGSVHRGLPLFRARSSLLHLVACSPSIMAVPPDLPPGARVTGAWFDRSVPARLPADLEGFLSSGAPPIVITFGSMGGDASGDLDTAVELLAAGDQRVIVQGRTAVNAPMVAAIGTVDHRALFPRASLVVHHGGAGTTHAACAAGVPSLVVPHVGDQRYWAHRLQRLGIAPAPLLRRDLHPERLAEEASDAVHNAAYRAAARQLAARIASEDGVGAALAAIEACA